MIGVIILLRDLIPGVQNRDPALGEQKCMQHDIESECLLQLSLILLVQRSLDSAQACGRSAQSGVSQPRIVIVQFASCIRVEQISAEIVIQELLVRDLVYAELLQKRVVQPPPDIIMAAQVIQEGILLREREYRFELMPQEADILRRDGMPGRRHRGNVIKDMALRLVYRSEIRHHLRRFHHHLSEKKRARTNHFRRHPHHPHQRMNLGQIAAGGPELLPDIRHRVQTDDVHAFVAKVQHIVRHVIKDHRIPVIQIPLIGIKGRHDNLPSLLAPGEVPGSRGGKHLGNGLLEFIRDRPVVKKEIPVLVLLLTAPRPPRPLMILAGVVHDKVQAQAHAPPVAGMGQILQILHRPERRIHASEV